MSHELVVVYTAAGQLQANIVKGLLEAEGIPAEILPQGAGEAYGLTVGPLGMVDVLVREENAAQAQALIEAMQRGELDE